MKRFGVLWAVVVACVAVAGRAGAQVARRAGGDWRRDEPYVADVQCGVGAAAVSDGNHLSPR
jgi:hypothetical protein